MDSNGSAAKENAVYVESIAGKIQNFNSAFEKFAYTTIDSDLVKWTVDFGKNILELTTNLGGLKPILVTTIGLLVAFKGAMVLENITNFSQSIIKTGFGLQSFKNMILGANAALKAYQAGIISATTLTEALLPILSLLTITTIGAVSFVKSLQKSTADLREEYEKTASQLDSVNNELDTTTSRIKELNEQESLTFVEQAELEKLKTTNKLLQEQKNILEKETSKKLGIAQSAERADASSRTAYNGSIISGGSIKELSSGTNIKSVANTLEQDIALYDEINKRISTYNSSNAQSEADLKKLEALKERLSQQGQKYLTEFQNENLSLNDRNQYYQKYLEILKMVDAYSYKDIKFQSFFDDNSTEQLSKGNKELLTLAQNGNVTEESIQQIINKYPDLQSAFTELQDEGMSILDFINNLKSMAPEDIANKISDAVTETVSTLADLISEMSDLNDALLEQSENGSLSISTAVDLIDKGYASVLMFDAETNAITIDTNAVKALTEAKLEAKATDIETSIATTIASLEKEAQVCAINNDAWIESIRIKKQAGAESLTTNEQTLLSLYAQKSALDGVKASLSQLGTSNWSTMVTGKSSSSSSKTWWEKQLETLKEQFNYNEITLQEYISSLSKLLSQLRRGSDEWREVNNLLQEQRLSKVEDDYKRGTLSLEQYIASLKDLIKTYKYGTDAWNNLADKIKKANDELLGNRKDDYDKAYDAATKLIDEEINKVQKLRDERSEYYDEQISSMQKLNDETERQITLTELQQNLINAQNEKNKRVFVAGIGWTWQADNQAINDAKKALTDFQNENAIKDLENARDAELATLDGVLDGWNNYKDAWSDIQNTFEDAQNRIMLAQQFGSNFEADILNGRLSALEKFKNNYINIQSQIASASGGIVPGINDYTGLANGTTLNSGIPNSSNIARLVSSYTAPSIIAPATGGGASYTYNFDNLVLPSVTNSQQFIAELKSMINLTKNQ